MKNVFLYVGLFVLLSIKSYGQGTDVIFWVDNSGSIVGSEFTQMQNSIQRIMQEVLTCNENNKVAVVSYGAKSSGVQFIPKIYIESDFTNNYNIGSNFSNHTTDVGSSDYANESLALIGNALDGISNSNIVSAQTTLSHGASQSLVVFLFTDAYRNNSNYVSYLVNKLSSGTGTIEAFQNYTTFKAYRHAKFVVVIVPPNDEARAAAAAIASTGGSYTGTVEYYPADPDGGGALGRRLITSGFDLTPTQVNTVTDFICSVAPVSCVPNLILTSPVNNVISGAMDNREAEISISASNSIAANGVGIYHAGTGITLTSASSTSGFYSASSSRFRAYIADCDTGYLGRPANAARMASITKDTNFFSLSPNPATTAFTVTSTLDIKHITVTSFDGKVMFNRDVKDKTTSYTIDTNGYTQGIYTVTVLTQTGETQTQKLIKN